MVRLTAEQKADLMGRIQKWLRRLNMGPYVVRIDDEELAPDNTILVCQHVKGRQLVYIQVGMYFSDELTEEDRENAVCHELLHIILHPLFESFQVVAEQLSPQSRDLALDQFHGILERIIDHLASVFAPVGGIRAGEAACNAHQEQGPVEGASCESCAGRDLEGDAGGVQAGDEDAVQQAS